MFHTAYPCQSTRFFCVLQMWGKLYDRQGNIIALCRKEEELYHFYDPNGNFLFKTKNITVKLATVLVENRKLSYIQ